MRILYIALAGTFFLLGALGIVLPGLPTTPFLLLTSYLLARSYPQWHRMLLDNKIIGPTLRDWEQCGKVGRHVKRKAVVLVAIAMFYLVYFSNLSPTPLGVFFALACMGLIVVYRLPCKP